ncbi:MAG: nucleoside deaminase [Magnetococcus sp. XQGC-1]
MSGLVGVDSLYLADEQAALLLALVAAGSAGEEGEVPVGAVLRDPAGRFLGECGNRCIASSDPTGHAELRLLRQAAARIGNYRLPGAVLAVTLAPCPICMAALAAARVARVAYEVDSPLAAAGPEGRGDLPVLAQPLASGMDSSIEIEYSDQYVVSSVPSQDGGKMGDAGALLRIFFAQRRKICSNEPFR